MWHRARVPVLPLCLVLACGLPVARGDVIDWSDGAGNDLWSAAANWTGTHTPPWATDIARFTNTGAAAAAGTVTNIADAPFGGVIGGIQFTNTTGSFHTTDLAGGNLFVDGDITVNLNINTTTSTAFRNGTLTVGSVATPRTITVGRRTVGGAGNYYGILDLTGITFDARVTDFLIGTMTTSGSPETAQGVVTLGTTNTIRATRILLGDSPGSTLTGIGRRSELHLGFSNTFNLNTFTIGGQKAEALADIVPGGTLTLAGNTVPEADLYVANNAAANTGTHALGTLDLTGGTFNATLDEIIIGRYVGTGTGSGRGTLIMDAGTVTANTLQMAVDTRASNTTTGTFTFRGGDLTVGAVSRGTGVATFDWEGGTLHLGTFGTSARPMDLLNTGIGTLAPGTLADPTGTTTLWGNYTQGPNATFDIDIGGYNTSQFDILDVRGFVNVTGLLDISLIGGFSPAYMSHFDVIAATGGITNAGIELGGPDGYMFAVSTYGNAGVSYLRLTAIPIPEPATAAMLALGLFGLARRRDRRTRSRARA
ncbi:MAG: PEP-CTERM sorting domain-containing protein [Planctomycetes bacterium]|nr:PEP-CTERM sorting domain-containing protein [Planctomycetota bacterium]